MRRPIALALVVAATAGCGGSKPSSVSGPSTFRVTVTEVNGKELPAFDSPYKPNPGNRDDQWKFTVVAVDGNGDPTSFDGYVRVTVRPGTVVEVRGQDAVGRNLLLHGGKGSGTASVTATYGPTRLWIEDIGYQPDRKNSKPECSNGKNDDPSQDGLIDYPSDPGCAYPDDNSETGGTFAAGVSNPVAYDLPRIVDIQGMASLTPYPNDAVEVKTTSPQKLVVTRVSSDGFYVTDIKNANLGYNSIFAFNFSTPSDMRVCDRVTYLAGTVNEFFGFTELSFPSYDLSFPILGKDPCLVPEPTLLDAVTIADPIAMEKLESGLVRVDGFSMPRFFGSAIAANNAFSQDASNCDLDGNGAIDFTDPAEASCASACDTDPECSEWTSFVSQGEIKVNSNGAMILVNLKTISAYDPTDKKTHLAETLASVRGTLREFSGGSLNWTIEARCPDDLICKTTGCSPAEKPAGIACVSLRTIDDNDEGTN